MVKVTVNLFAEEVDFLKRTAGEDEISITQRLREAIATDKFLRLAYLRGAKILIEEPDGKINQLVFKKAASNNKPTPGD